MDLAATLKAALKTQKYTVKGLGLILLSIITQAFFSYAVCVFQKCSASVQCSWITGKIIVFNSWQRCISYHWAGGPAWCTSPCSSSREWTLRVQVSVYWLLLWCTSGYAFTETGNCTGQWYPRWCRTLRDVLPPLPSCVKRQAWSCHERGSNRARFQLWQGKRENPHLLSCRKLLACLSPHLPIPAQPFSLLLPFLFLS